jgi:hypothetical protein
VYALLLMAGRPIAYGMLRGWDEGFDVPATRTRGLERGELLMVIDLEVGPAPSP